MPFSVKKSACMHVSGRFKAKCANIVTRAERELSWVNNIRYLGIYIESASSFKCLLDAANSVAHLTQFLGKLDELPQMK